MIVICSHKEAQDSVKLCKEIARDSKEIARYLGEHALVRFYPHRARTHPEHQEREVSGGRSWSWTLFRLITWHREE